LCQCCTLIITYDVVGGKESFQVSEENGVWASVIFSKLQSPRAVHEGLVFMALFSVMLQIVPCY
jgi:hypothetical protein